MSSHFTHFGGNRRRSAAPLRTEKTWSDFSGFPHFSLVPEAIPSWAADMPADRREERLYAAGLYQSADGALLRPVFGLPRARENQHPDRRQTAVATEDTDHFGSVHDGHVDVQKDQGRQRLCRDEVVERGLTVRRVCDGEARSLQGFAQDGPQIVVVVDNKDLRL